jgi:hypothetical protein
VDAASGGALDATANPAPTPEPPGRTDCSRIGPDYLFASLDACLTSTFTCGGDEAAFADACGCGCEVPSFSESGLASTEVAAGPLVELPAECNGRSGRLALFSEAVGRLRLASDEVFVLVGMRAEQTTWSVSKADGSVSLIDVGVASPFDAETEPFVVSEHGAVVDAEGPLPAEDGFTYALEGEWLVRTPSTGGSAEPLFSADRTFAFIVFDGAYVGVTDTGVLTHAWLTDEPVEPVALEQRGAFDDDDYAAIQGIDEDAAYWSAGSDPLLRTSDGDPLALYRTCRPAQ